jgi:hypothetical protein
MRGFWGVPVCTALLLVGLGGSAGAVTVSVTGPQEMVYDWSTQACQVEDIPDLPARAFRDSLGRTQLTLSLYTNHRMVGPDLNHLIHDCQVTMASDRDPLPSNYDDADWLAAPYSLPNGEIYALVHDEYHGAEHPGGCPSGVFGQCRYNTMTLAKSVTNGDTFQRYTPPTNLVASMPYQYVPDAGRFGVFQPSNIIQKDGFYYAFVLVSRASDQQEAGECLMRTGDLSDPKSWRAWDGEGFTVRFIDPYRETAEPLSRSTCKPVDPDDVKLAESVVYDTFVNKYVTVGGEAKYDPVSGKNIWGFYYTTSDDLIHWTPRQLLMQVQRFQTHTCGDPDPLVYPSLIDPSSTDRNYTTAGQTAYVYYTRFNYSNCQLSFDRDLLRTPIQFSP